MSLGGGALWKTLREVSALEAWAGELAAGVFHSPGAVPRSLVSQTMGQEPLKSGSRALSLDHKILQALYVSEIFVSIVPLLHSVSLLV